MKRVIAAVLLAAACVAGSTSGYAQRGGFARGAPRAPDPTTLLGGPTPQTTFQNLSPAPLASPPQATVANRPPTRSPYGGSERYGIMHECRAYFPFALTLFRRLHSD